MRKEIVRSLIWAAIRLKGQRKSTRNINQNSPLRAMFEWRHDLQERTKSQMFLYMEHTPLKATLQNSALCSHGTFVFRRILAKKKKHDKTN